MLIPTTITSLLALIFLGRAAALKSNPQNRKFSVTAKEYLRSRKKELDQYLQDDRIDQLFKEAGNPLGFTGIMYQYIRHAVIFLFVVFQLPAFLMEPELIRLILMGIQAGALYGLSMPSEYFPVTMLLKSIKQYNVTEKNRELFMIYSLIADEITNAKDDRMNLKALLDETRDYTRIIRPAIDRALYNWRLGTKAALDVLSREIGTLEADEMTKILADLEESNAEKAIQLIADRRETFITAQKENRRRKLKSFATFGYIVAFAPILIYGWNMMNLIMSEVSYLTDFTNNYKQ